MRHPLNDRERPRNDYSASGTGNTWEGVSETLWAGCTTEVVAELRRRVTDLYKQADASAGKKSSKRWKLAAQQMVAALAEPHLPRWGYRR